MQLHAGLCPPNVHFRTDHRRTIHLDGAVSQFRLGGQLNAKRLRGTVVAKFIRKILIRYMHPVTF